MRLAEVPGRRWVSIYSLWRSKVELRGKYPPAGKLRRPVQSQGLGHGGIQEQLTEPSRHAPAEGPVRFYRRDDDGQLEFTGENDIDHTPKDETIRLYTGNAFDLTGERTRTEYRADFNARWIDESFEIKVRNHKTTPGDVRIVEHLYRWTSWDILKNSDQFKKLDSKTIEFKVSVRADGEKTVSYKVHYSW